MKIDFATYLLVGLFFLSGCATYNPATGRNEFIFVSTSSEVSMGKNLHAELTRKNKILEGSPQAIRLNKIGQRLARISDRQDYQYHFFLVDSDDVNAFTIPGGYIYFYTGLFDKLKTDDEIAAVLAHEIGHCAAKHTIKKFQGALEYNIFSNIALNILALKAPGAERIASMGANGIMSLAMSSYSRKDEFEADRLGIKYLHLAGYNLDAMISVFDVLQTQDKGQGPPVFLRSHPIVKDRVAAVKKVIDEVKANEQRTQLP